MEISRTYGTDWINHEAQVSDGIDKVEPNEYRKIKVAKRRGSCNTQGTMRTCNNCGKEEK